MQIVVSSELNTLMYFTFLTQSVTKTDIYHCLWRHNLIYVKKWI